MRSPSSSKTDPRLVLRPPCKISSYIDKDSRYQSDSLCGYRFPPAGLGPDDSASPSTRQGGAQPGTTRPTSRAPSRLADWPIGRVTRHHSTLPSFIGSNCSFAFSQPNLVFFPSAPFCLFFFSPFFGRCCLSCLIRAELSCAWAMQCISGSPEQASENKQTDRQTDGQRQKKG